MTVDSRRTGLQQNKTKSFQERFQINRLFKERDFSKALAIYIFWVKICAGSWLNDFTPTKLDTFQQSCKSNFNISQFHFQIIHHIEKKEKQIQDDGKKLAGCTGNRTPTHRAAVHSQGSP